MSHPERTISQLRELVQALPTVEQERFARVFNVTDQ